jgi:hypothetical protein
MGRPGDQKSARARAERAGVVGTPCARCGHPILPGQKWDLDHVDEAYVYGGQGRRLPSHARCNRQHGARLGNARRAAQKRGRSVSKTTITVWPALGIEVAADRSKTWVARAAFDAERLVVVELLDPIPGTMLVVATVAGWRTEWKAETVAIDPRSPSATLVDPLKAEGIPLKLTDAHGMAVAHGKFQDLVTEGRLLTRGHDALDQAARQAQERKLAGAQAVDRYAGADQAPLVAAELAVWALDDDAGYDVLDSFY